MSFLMKNSFCKKVIKRPSLCDVNLIGRDYTCPIDLTSEEVKSLLWTAICIRHCANKNVNMCNKALRNILQKAKITVLLHDSCIRTQLALNSAATLLNTRANIIVNSESEKIFYDTAEDYGRILATHSDIIFCLNNSHLFTTKIAEGSHVPVIEIESLKYSIIQVLSHIMTMQLKFNHLKNLNFGYVGLHGSLINTYLCMLPALGINVHYFIVNENLQSVSPTDLIVGKKQHKRTGTEFLQCKCVKDVAEEADVIMTSYHTNEKLMVKKQHIKAAHSDYALFSTFPHATQIQSEIYKDKSIMTWEAFKNLRYIYAAVIIRFLAFYEHYIAEPPFDGTPVK